MEILLALLAFWSACVVALLAWRGHLLHRTWHEPYLGETVIVIESDDWGPGPPAHADALRRLLAELAAHRDSTGRPAVLTADLVLSVPDAASLRDPAAAEVASRTLESYPEMLAALRGGMAAGTLVPQIHGLAHLNAVALARAARAGDRRLADLADDWWDWEALDSPLQAHYVDGTILPTRPQDESAIERLVTDAQALFRALFGFPSLSTVAPCYLWDEGVERAWAAHGIRYVQTAGYRCPGRDAEGRYLQDLKLLRSGDRGRQGQVYLVRNVHFEPRDGNGPGRARADLRRAVREAAPAVICTHRYNYVGSAPASERAVADLGRLLDEAAQGGRPVRYVASPELGAWLAGEPGPLRNPADGSAWPTLRAASPREKLAGFLYRLWHRHSKLRLATIATGLVLPAALVALFAGGRR